VLIPLYNRRGEVIAHATVDDVDADLMQFRWCRVRAGYAMRNANADDGTRRSIYMHREIMALVHGDGLEVDHISGDKLDNRRANMRVVTHAENTQNITVGGRGYSRHRGVTWDISRGKWLAQVTVRGQHHHLGRFDDEEDAAAAAAAFRAQRMPFSLEAMA
jgi:hypothetical protein